MVPPLVNSPPLLMGAVAIWVACLLYVALLHRTPRSYLFMLAAYTLPLIALPAVDNPVAVFDLAVARSEEICLGILCASVVGASCCRRAWPTCCATSLGNGWPTRRCGPSDMLSARRRRCRATIAAIAGRRYPGAGPTHQPALYDAESAERVRAARNCAGA
jgi:hypothetical protein